MDEVLKAINSISYFVNEYKNGNPDVDESTMKYIAKESIKHTSVAKYQLLFYKLTLGIMNLKTLILSYETLSDPDYQELYNKSLSDLKFYYESSRFLREYLKTCIKKHHYDELDDAYLLAVKLSSILGNLPVYSKDMNTIIDSNNSMFKMVLPPNRYDEETEKVNESNEIIKKLKKSLES